LPIEEIEEGDGTGGEIGFAFAESDKLFGMRVREWAKQHAIDDGEECGVGADAEGQDENCGGGEGRIAQEEAESETCVLEKRFREGEGALITDLLFGLFQAAELEEALAASFGGGHSAAEMVLDVKLKVGVELSG
jgi:hypothetical protein